MKRTGFDISGRYSTGDNKLACALLTNGVSLDPAHPTDLIKSDTGDYWRFHFLPTTLDGKHRTVELTEAWAANGRKIREMRAGHVIDLPEDGMGYCSGYAENYKNLGDFLRQQIPQILIRRGKQIAIISENAGLPLESQILGKIR